MDLNKVFDKKSLGYFFNWERLAGGNLPKIDQHKVSSGKSFDALKSIDVYGYLIFSKIHIASTKKIESYNK